MAARLSWRVSRRHDSGPEPVNASQEAPPRKPLAPPRHVPRLRPEHSMAHLWQRALLEAPRGMWPEGRGTTAYLLHVLHDNYWLRCHV